MNQIVFSFLFRDFAEVHIYGPCEDKSTEWVGRYHCRTLCRTQPFLSNNSNWFLHFCSEDFAGMAGLKSYLWPLWRQIHRMSWEISFHNLVELNHFRVILQIGFFILVQRILHESMGLAKTNPQNELGDIISEPCVELNRFRVIIQIGFFILVQRILQEWRV